MNRPSSDPYIVAVLLFFFAAISLMGCASVSPDVGEERPFFQAERETSSHGRKTWLDNLVELDPGRIKVEMAPDYQEHPPATLAVLPFCDKGSGNFTVDKIPITFRNSAEQDNWAWTDSQRLRRSAFGYLAQREFRVINPIAVDAVLQRQGIDNMKKLRAASPVQLGRLLGADALVYGTVDNYEGYYFGLLSAHHVGVSMWMLSTRDGETLMHASGGRYSVDLSPALSPQDVVINSALTLLEFRDVTLARAEEEVSRELVFSIPVSRRLESQLASRALERAEDVEAGEEAGAASEGKIQSAETVVAPSLPEFQSAPDAARIKIAYRPNQLY